LRTLLKNVGVIQKQRKTMMRELRLARKESCPR
jgi:hypothetical protein